MHTCSSEPRMNNSPQYPPTAAFANERLAAHTSSAQFVLPAAAAAAGSPLLASFSASASGSFPVYTPSTVRPVTPSLRPDNSVCQSLGSGLAPSGCGGCGTGGETQDGTEGEW